MIKPFRFTFRPILFHLLRYYSKADFVADLGAGVTVAFVGLPLAIAFAIASGVAPVAGLTTAIVAGFFIALLGGSRLQVSGPTGAFVTVVYAILMRYGFADLLLCTFLSGAILFAMGAAHLGNMIRFIPVSIVVGFTNGIAVFIAISQIKDLFGLDIDKVPPDFFSKITVLFKNFTTIDGLTTTISALSLLILVLWPRLARSRNKLFAAVGRTVPGPIIVLILGTAIVGALLPWIHKQYPDLTFSVATIGSVYGGIPSSLPSPQWFDFSLGKITELLPSALTIALLGAIESLLSARVADSLAGQDDRHDSNQELMAQGVGNMLAPIWGGLPATGAIARTAANIRANGKTPVSALVHSITLLLIMLLAAPLAASVPLASLAAILMITAYNMGNWQIFRMLRRYSIRYRIIMLTTFLLTVLLDLTVAVQVGLVLASITFIYRMSSVTHIDPIELSKEDTDAGIVAYRIFGTLFFGDVGKMEKLSDFKHSAPKVMILELHQVIAIDRTGLETIEGLHRALKRHGGRLILCGVTPQPEASIRRSSFYPVLRKANLLPSLSRALERAHHLINHPHLHAEDHHHD